MEYYPGQVRTVSDETTTIIHACILCYSIMMPNLLMYLQEYFSLNGLQQSPTSLTLDLQSARTTGKYTGSTWLPQVQT